MNKSRKGKRPHKLLVKTSLIEFENTVSPAQVKKKKSVKKKTSIDKFSFKHMRGFKKVENIAEIYEWQQELGVGQFGTVHEARVKLLDTKCALKVIKKSKMAEDKVFEELMKQELEVLEKLEHPHIVRVLDLCEDDDKIYIALELIKHGNLLEVLSKIRQRNIKFTERDAADIVYQILLAINYIHASNVIHRDLKLENIMVDMEETEDGQSELICKVTDFGFACKLNPETS